MKKGLTEIICVLDKSGSMEDVKNDAIGGFNRFITEQQKLPGDATVTVALFDSPDSYKLLYNGVDIKNIPILTNETYVPFGFTALLDAIGRTIDAVGHRLDTTPEENKPEKVIFAILTDGEENASEKYTRPQIFDKITHQREKYSWEFIFLAANQDAIQSGGKLGVQLNIGYTGDGIGTRSAYDTLNFITSSYRRG